VLSNLARELSTLVEHALIECCDPTLAVAFIAGLTANPRPPNPPAGPLGTGPCKNLFADVVGTDHEVTGPLAYRYNERENSAACAADQESVR
jgi:hypothetical protein